MQAAWGEAGQGEIGPFELKIGRQKTEKVVMKRFQQIEGIHQGKTSFIQLSVVHLFELSVCPLHDGGEEKLVPYFDPGESDIGRRQRFIGRQKTKKGPTI